MPNKHGMLGGLGAGLTGLGSTGGGLGQYGNTPGGGFYTPLPTYYDTDPNTALPDPSTWNASLGSGWASASARPPRQGMWQQQMGNLSTGLNAALQQSLTPGFTGFGGQGGLTGFLGSGNYGINPGVLDALATQGSMFFKRPRLRDTGMRQLYQGLSRY